MDFESEFPRNLRIGLRQMAEALDASKLPYALIGGIAVGYRSRPRFTKDIDFVLAVPQIKLPALLDDLHGRGFVFETEKTIEELTKYHLTMMDYHGVRVDWLKPISARLQARYRHRQNRILARLFDCDRLTGMFDPYQAHRLSRPGPSRYRGFGGRQSRATRYRLHSVRVGNDCSRR